MANVEQAQLTEPASIEESFRISLDDCIEILEKVGPLCNDLDDLIAMLKLAGKNDASAHVDYEASIPRPHEALSLFKIINVDNLKQLSIK